MSALTDNLFLTEALGQIPRLLGQLNRNSSSRSYGSFDRAYWHYRTNDISSCRYQEAVYTLSLLYFSPFADNVYHQDGQVLEWIRAALVFTATLQHPDGSFDEWYVNEGSYVGTAFLTAALAQTLLLFKSHDVSLPETKRIEEVIERSSNFLLTQQETRVLNQVAGAVYALAATGQLLSADKISKGAERLLDSFLSLQNAEGWWSEYGGPDVGYLSLAISYLEKYQRLVGGEKVGPALERARQFILYFVHPDQTAGGEYLSRNTEYLIPSATLPYLTALRPAHLDDRYLCYILYNWIETGLVTSPRSPARSAGEKYFSASGILRVATDHYFLVVGGKKGGSLRLYAGGKVYYDSGLELTVARGKYSTGILDQANQLSCAAGVLTVIGKAKKISEPLLPTGRAVMFKIWQMAFGRFGWPRSLVKNFLRSRMISYRGAADLPFKRVITYTPECVTITDIVEGVQAKDAIVMGAKSAYTAVPSSKYAPIPELANLRLTPHLDIKKEHAAWVIERIFSFHA